jgi:hypothetical protein
MKPQYALCLWILLAPVVLPGDCPQSLSELAKKEAERRKLLDQQGIEAKRIDQKDAAKLAAKGNISLSSLPPNSRSPSMPPTQLGKKPSLEKYRTALQRLDSEIRRDEERLASLRKRLELEKDVPIRLGRGGRPSAASISMARLQNQVQDLEIKLRRLRDDRLKTYDAARKAGFLPGDLKP